MRATGISKIAFCEDHSGIQIALKIEGGNPINLDMDFDVAQDMVARLGETFRYLVERRAAQKAANAAASRAALLREMEEAEKAPSGAI